MTKLHRLGLCVIITFYQGLIGAAQPGFISIDCGATSAYTDPATGISWVPDTNYTYGGSVANLSQSLTSSQPLQTLRYFPESQNKNCFSVGPLNVSSRYLVRTTFLYGSYDNARTFPVFDISVDASPWATVTVTDATAFYFQEFIAVPTKSSDFVVCLIRGPTGSPFISTLEVRPLSGAMYSASYFGTSFLTNTVRINYGAPSDDYVRFPDDPADRIWVSDKVWPLQGQAPGTYNISTVKDVLVDTKSATDVPPEKVMQTAVVGGQGYLSYRLNLPGYPASCYAVIYFAEIEDLGPGDIREFTFESNINGSLFAGSALNLVRDAGAYTAYEPGFVSLVVPSFLNFQLVKTNDSNFNPLMNALEIYQILPIITGTYSPDVQALSSFSSQLSPGESLGDPCLPVAWDYLGCSSESPPRISSINLSGRNLSGEIPGAIGGLTGLVNLWLDNNQLTGNVPDLSALVGLQTLHLQNNQLSGSFPVSLEDLNNLSEIYVENNDLSGTVPLSLLQKNGLTIRASGNPNLCADLSCQSSRKSNDINLGAIVGGSVGGAVLIMILAAVTALLFWKHRKKSKTADPVKGSHFPLQQSSTTLFGFTGQGDAGPPPGDVARRFNLPELVEATEDFAKVIGSGGYGPVYYGRAKDGQEIAVKVLSVNSNQGAREFFNEVNLLSRIHHRNLVALIGYCPDIKERMLVYQYMHKGSLRDHLYGPLSKDEPLGWLARLNIALDSAKGIEYLHTGCSPSIIHRDVKSSNILINDKLEGKVADFGLSKLTSEDVAAVSTTVRGTVGYLDPEYYVSQQLTTKSDVFSFGVVLLEIISGREPIVVGQPLNPDSNLVNWARTLVQKGDVQSMVDPKLGVNFRTESLWKLAEVALRSVEPYGKYRPTMGEIVLELTEILSIERQDSGTVASASDSFHGFSLMQSYSPSRSFNYDSSSIDPLHSSSVADSFDEPVLR